MSDKGDVQILKRFYHAGKIKAWFPSVRKEVAHIAVAPRPQRLDDLARLHFITAMQNEVEALIVELLCDSPTNSIGGPRDKCVCWRAMEVGVYSGRPEKVEPDKGDETVDVWNEEDDGERFDGGDHRCWGWSRSRGWTSSRQRTFRSEVIIKSQAPALRSKYIVDYDRVRPVIEIYRKLPSGAMNN